MVCTCFYAYLRTYHHVVWYLVCCVQKCSHLICVLCTIGCTKKCAISQDHVEIIFFLWLLLYSHFSTFIYDTVDLHWSVPPCSCFLHVSVHAYAYMSCFISLVPLLWHDAAILVLSFFLCTWECFCARFVHINTLLATFTSLLFMCCVCMRASDGDPCVGIYTICC